MSTTDRVRVTIDLNRVADNLRFGQTPAGPDVARTFLQHAGFRPETDTTWLATRAELRHLNHSEVVRVEQLAW